VPSSTFRDLYSEDEATKLEGALKDALRPLTDALQVEEERIPKLRAELAKAQKRRKALIASIRSVDKSAMPQVNKQTPKQRGLPVGEQHRVWLEQVTEWLQAHKEELDGNGGFRATDVVEVVGSPFSSGNASKYLTELHALGVLHLDRYVPGPSSDTRKAGKFYRVV
jgi:hypothetical protein